MKHILTICMAALCLNTTTMAKQIRIRLLQTSDVHGCFFPYDFINRKPMAGSMARLATYADSLRNIYKDNLIMLDNGDILQGQPTCYYCNYVKPERRNVAAEVINYLNYDAQTIGNHDIETGHAVYDKWISEVRCPMLGANIIDTKTGKPYLIPYIILQREGIKIAVIGMLTPAIPNWLNENLWSNLRFEEMTSCARRWMNYLKKNENPDIIIGLFHSGREGGIHTDEYDEDASLRVAKEVPGFDIVFYGHDHTMHKDMVTNAEGHNVLCLDPSCNALALSDAEITLTVENGKIAGKDIRGGIKTLDGIEPSRKFMEHFKDDIDSINSYVNRRIGTFTTPIHIRDSYFGNSAFCDLIHNLQLQITGADISFNAPLTFNSTIGEGDVYVSDMFNLYKYENQIYVIRMTGKEIHGHLEMSYDQWVNTMTCADDHIMLLNSDTRGDRQRWGFKNLTFNFDSAAGIDYEVDVTKPDGQKVRILRMSDGKPFDEKRWYNVVMNSYRGNGGGELLTRGAGIPHSELKSRIIYESERDQRYYLMKAIEKAGVITPKPNSNWKFVPAEWTGKAIERDRRLIFGN